MSQLRSLEKRIFEGLFDRGGYVLDFSDRTFADFFRENGINIEDNKYFFNGSSKMKRLRAFWEVEPDHIVGKLLEALLEYACELELGVSKNDKEKALRVIHRLQGKPSENKSNASTERDFLRQEFEQINWEKLNIGIFILPAIKQRITEIQKAIEADIPLSVIFLCGSTLEGLLMDRTGKHQQLFNQANAAPKDEEGRVKQFHNWSLNSLIDAAHEIGLLDLDVKKHSHSLKDFRNYIHPYQQAQSHFTPNAHTAKISWQVLQAAITQMSKNKPRSSTSMIG